MRPSLRVGKEWVEMGREVQVEVETEVEVEVGED